MDDEAFSTEAFSTSAWEFFGAVAAAAINFLLYMRRKNRR